MWAEGCWRWKCQGGKEARESKEEVMNAAREDTREAEVDEEDTGDRER